MIHVFLKKIFNLASLYPNQAEKAEKMGVFKKNSKVKYSAVGSVSGMKKTQKEKDLETGVNLIYQTPLPDYKPSHFEEKIITEDLRQRYQDKILDQPTSFGGGEKCPCIKLQQFLKFNILYCVC